MIELDIVDNNSVYDITIPKLDTIDYTSEDGEEENYKKEILS